MDSLTHNNSVYIPNIVSPTGHIVDVDYITYLFEMIWVLGSVNRVDIFDVLNDKGVRVVGKRGAFVHMNFWECNSSTELILEEIMKTGQCQLWLTNNTNNGRGCYWYLKKMNREPIKETELNAHQLADKLREMEELLAQRDAEIKRLNNIIKQNNYQNDDAHDDEYGSFQGSMALDELNTSIYEYPSVDNSMTVDELNISIDEYGSFNNTLTIDDLNTPIDDYGPVDNTKMTLNELNTSIDDQNTFKTGLDMKTRQQFTSHLCNN